MQIVTIATPVTLAQIVTLALTLSCMYVLRTEPVRFPSAGLHRTHHAAVKVCVCVCVYVYAYDYKHAVQHTHAHDMPLVLQGGSGGNILSGTAAGELIVISEAGVTCGTHAVCNMFHTMRHTCITHHVTYITHTHNTSLMPITPSHPLPQDASSAPPSLLHPTAHCPSSPSATTCNCP